MGIFKALFIAGCIFGLYTLMFIAFINAIAPYLG